jgi:two-component system nitrate/nitrite response regulator NarL
MIAYVHHQRPDACLIDCNLEVDEGLRTIQRVVEASQDTTIVVLGADPGAESAELALDAGASGYLHQSRGVDVLVSALERMPNGERVVDVPDTGPARKPRRASHADTVAATLTARERECLSLLVAGLDTAAIMSRMGVSRTTVRTHLQAVLTKLGVHSRLEAASFAVRHNLVDAWAEPAAAVPVAHPSRASTAALAGPAQPARRPAALRDVGSSRWQRTAMRAVGIGPDSAPAPSWNRAVSLAASG